MIRQKTIATTQSPTRFRKLGQSLIEYTLILGGLSFLVWSALILMGDSVSGKLTVASHKLTDAKLEPFTNLDFSAVPNNSNDPKTVIDKSAINKTDSISNENLLSIHALNGGEMNVSSAEGLRIREARTKTLQETRVISQNLFKLATESNAPNLKLLSEKALISASLQATHQLITDPTNPANTHIDDLAQITMQNFNINMLNKRPENILPAIENLNQNLKEGIESILNDNGLTAAQKEQSVSLIRQVIESTQLAYNLNQLASKSKAINIEKLDTSPETFNKLYKAAENALSSDLSNQALETTLTNGLALQETPSQSSADVNTQQKALPLISPSTK
jgi:hypothetical protein